MPNYNKHIIRFGFELFKSVKMFLGKYINYTTGLAARASVELSRALPFGGGGSKSLTYYSDRLTDIIAF